MPSNTNQAGRPFYDIHIYVYIILVSQCLDKREKYWAMAQEASKIKKNIIVNGNCETGKTVISLKSFSHVNTRA